MIPIFYFEDLNKGQKEGVGILVDWNQYQPTQYIDVTGGAGTGKSTFLGVAIERMGYKPHEVLYCTYVGQASLVLRMKGLNSKTIHSTIYDLVDDFVTDELGNYVISRDNKRIPTKKFILKQSLGPHVKLIVVDEGSMVPENIARDLLSFGIPIVAVGDLNQLGPIFGKGFFLRNPQVNLREIMRQAKDSPIVKLAHMALNGYDIPVGLYGNCAVLYESQITRGMYVNSSILICGKNDTRNRLNKYMREDIFGRKGVLPVMGDKVICRKNNWQTMRGDIALVNGMTGTVNEHIDLSSFNPSAKTFNMSFQPDLMKDDYFEDLLIDYEFFITPSSTDKVANRYNMGNKFEYGYATTVHLAQGSEYLAPMVFEEVLNYAKHKNWLYTAITRAIAMIIIVKRDRR